MRAALPLNPPAIRHLLDQEETASGRLVRIRRFDSGSEALTRIDDLDANGLTCHARPEIDLPAAVLHSVRDEFVDEEADVFQHIGLYVRSEAINRAASFCSCLGTRTQTEMEAGHAPPLPLRGDPKT